MADEKHEQFLVFEGVEMKPGVHVFCTDRDDVAWDEDGIIVSAARIANQWEFGVDFGGGLVRPHLWDQIRPTSEELDSERARAWRAARALKVFLCHGSEDKAAVRHLYQRLQDDGMRPWLDEKDIEPGADWNPAIRDAIRNCHIVLVCLSRTSVGKTGYVQKEIKYALDRADEMPEGKKYIIPVRLEECNVPSRLGQWQWVNLYDPDGYERLLTVLRKYAMELHLA